MSKFVETKKGSRLPLMNLKGKDYMMVAYRLQWLSDDYDNYEISSEILELSEEQAVIKSTVIIYDAAGKVLRKASATKKETKKDFPDFIEKCETGSIGRALAMIGLGTQHAVAELDEGTRLADAPLMSITLKDAQSAVTLSSDTPPKKTSSFRKAAAGPKPVELAELSNDDSAWS